MVFRCALACAIAASLGLAACGGSGGDGLGNSGNGLTPFATSQTDELPPGTRIDVSSQNLFQMGTGDFWQYAVLNASGTDTGQTVFRQVTSGPDGTGHVSLADSDGGTTTTHYVVSADGLLDEDFLDGAPPGVKSIVGGIFEYATPLYPVGAVRRHVRSGPWGQDLDGDGVGESFRLEYTQVFAGFESVQLSQVLTLNNVAHFSNTGKVTLRPTAAGNTDYTITISEEAWFAPGLGMVKAVRTTVDSDGFTLEPLHTILFRQGTVAGVNWNVLVPPPPPLDGSFVDVPLTHNALVYDSVRNVYYASVPGSVIGNGNRIATIDPANGLVSYSAPVGSEPNALALAADASALYVGLDGSGDVAKLTLPAMTELARTKLKSDPFLGQTHAARIAVSPADAGVVAVSMAYTLVSPSHAGVVLLRDMVAQPKAPLLGMLIAFDSSGTTLYAVDVGSSAFPLFRAQVLADGLAQDLVIAASVNFANLELSFLNNRVIAGHTLYGAPALDLAGTIASQSDCKPQRSGALLMCFDTASFNPGLARILLVDPGTFVIQASLLHATSESGGPRRLVEGPAGQVAISYPITSGFVSKIRLFTSAKLPTPPAPPAPTWQVTPSSTADGQALDLGLTHKSIVYDAARNVYYASVPGSVVGAGNSIATIDPATGQVTHSAPVGSEPGELAIAADGSVLYVGLDGSGEVLRLTLPAMTPAGRARLLVNTSFGGSRAQSIAVSPADASVAAVSMATIIGFSPSHVGVALLRDMVVQPNMETLFLGSDLVTFDAAGTKLYGLNREGESGLRRMGVLADGLTVELRVTATSTGFLSRVVSFSGGRVVAGGQVFDAPALTIAGTISGASDCWPARSATGLLCLSGQSGHVLVANSATFVIAASPVFYTNAEPDLAKRLVQGPAGQIAVSYIPFFTTPSIRLFSSAQLP